jgi:hypothetical protein
LYTLARDAKGNRQGVPVCTTRTAGSIYKQSTIVKGRKCKVLPTMGFPIR